MREYRKEIIELLDVILDVNKDILTKLSMDEDISNYGLNSINAIQLVVLIEEKFGIELLGDDMMIENLNTIEKLENLLERHNKMS